MTNRSKTKKIIDWLNTGWGAVLSAFTIFSMGFALGIYVNNWCEKLENYKKDIDYNQALFDYKIEKEKEIFELRSTVNKMQSELIELQNRNDDEKK